MKKILFIIITGVAFNLASCREVNPNANIDEGKVEGNVYTSQEISWTVEIPKGWTVINKEQVQETNKKGRKVLEETMGGEVDVSGLKNLISFQKNQFNNLHSTSQPFELEFAGEWEEKNVDLKDMIYATYENQGIKVDSTAITIETIDEVDFQTYGFTIYSPEGKIILKQILYSKLINGFDFGVNINYNNDKDRNELLKVFRNSKFKK